MLDSNRVGPAGDLDRPDSRISSITEFVVGTVQSSASRKRSVASRIQRNDTYSVKAAEFLKLLLVVLPPLIVMAVLAAVNMSEANRSRQAALQLQSNLENAESIRGLVTALQRERGVTCLLISSER